MNNGAFGENFPYSNFHDLNMDWIVKTVKEFEDHYSKIHESVETGKEEINESVETGKEEITETVAQELNDAINEFNTNADEKGQEVLDSIPEDYTQLIDDVDSIHNLLGTIDAVAEDGYVGTRGVMETTVANFRHTDIENVKAGNTIYIYCYALTTVTAIARKTSSTTYKSEVMGNDGFGLYSWTADCDCTITVSYDSARTHLISIDTDTDNIKVIKNIQYGANTSITNLNDVAPNSVYRIQNNSITNFPSGLPGGIYLLFTIQNTLGTSDFIFQFLVHPYNGQVWATREYSGGWSTWIINIPFYSMGNVSANNIDLDNQTAGAISFTTTGIPSGFPELNYAGRNLSVMCRKSNRVLSDWDSQFIYVDNSHIFISRLYYNDQWQNWTMTSPNLEIHIGSGYQYTTLRAGFAEAVKHKGCTVYVHAGTYDLATEFSDVITNHEGRGIKLGNDIHAVFFPGSEVVAEFNGSDEWVHENFEPFYAVSQNYTLEGLNIRTKNCRYCVHDETNGQGTYFHKYINCRMYHEDTLPNARFVQCIGGGMGEHAYIEIVGGTYQSKATYYNASHYSSANDMQQPITYHNSAYNALGYITIQDVYFADKGYLRFGNYGTSTDKTLVQICGCQFYKNPMLMNETWDESQTVNFEILRYRNTTVV